jgi:hypothetical protein
VTRDEREKFLRRAEAAVFWKVTLMSWLEKQNKSRQIGWE